MWRKKVSKLLLVLITLVSLLGATSNEISDLNDTLRKEKETKQRQEDIKILQEDILNLAKQSIKEGVLWQKSYDSYTTYLEVAQELKEVRKKIKKL